MKKHALPCGRSLLRLIGSVFILLSFTAIPVAASELLRDAGPYKRFIDGGAGISRRVVLDPAALGTSFSFSIGGRSFEVNDADLEFPSENGLSRSAVLRADAAPRVEPEAYSPGSVTVRFDFEDSPYGGSTITRRGGLIFATLSLREGVFTVAPRADGSYILAPAVSHECTAAVPSGQLADSPEHGSFSTIQRLLSLRFPAGTQRERGAITARTESLALTSHASGGRRRAVRHPGPLVHVHRHMLVYSDGMLTLFGGHEPVKAFFQHTIDVQNTANQDTGGLATIKDELAAATYVAKAPYDGAFWDDALKMVSRDLQINALSVELKAPIVGVWNVDETRTGGSAYQYNGGTAWEYGFYAVTFSKFRYEMGGEFQTPQHEVGHVKGLAHDRHVDPKDYFFKANHAFVDCEAGFSDVMAYSYQCTTVRLLRYSNKGSPMQGVTPPYTLGSDDSDGAGVLRLTAPEIAKFIATRTAGTPGN